MLDHDARSYDDIAAAFAGQPVGSLTRDEVLDNITLTWVTNTGVSWVVSTRGEHPRLLRRQGRLGPGGGERLPQRALPGTAELDEQAYPNHIYFNEVDKGGHFAAWQQPELFSKEVRAAFRSLR